MPAQELKSATPAAENPDATRIRLIEAATHVFAEHGFQSATVRDICTRAGANVAAVNYHFRDKAGLYLAVLRHSITLSGVPEPRDAATQAASPEESLRQMITAILRRMYATSGSPSYHFRIMVHEISKPTEALPRVVEEMMRPNHDALRAVVGRLLNKAQDDDVTRFCAHSIIGQIVHYAHARPVIDLLWPDLKTMPEQLDRIAAHISRFSLQAIKHFEDMNSHE